MGATNLDGALETLVLRIRSESAAIRMSSALKALERHYRPDQPRVPAGSPEGGQWTDEGIGGRVGRVAAGLEQLRLAGQRVGFGDDRVVRHCYYANSAGVVVHTLELDAILPCPPFYPFVTRK